MYPYRPVEGLRVSAWKKVRSFCASETVSTVDLRTRTVIMQKFNLNAGRRRCREQGVSCALVLALAASLTLASAEEVGPRIGESMPVSLKKLYINNRRYLGNKYKLLSAIRRVVDENCEGVRSFVDIFAGTGSVASAFPDKKLLVNDILYCNHICHIAWFSGERYSEKNVAALIERYNRTTVDEDNYMSETFADTYFSKSDCRKIGYVREDVESRYLKGEINARERALLITSLLYAMDKIANTVGHYDAYRKDASFDRHLELRLPVPPNCKCKSNKCFNQDANQLTPQLGLVDVFFMDPPYNSRQYSDAYHVLENVARWEKPEVAGVARKMDRSSLKSDYCTRKAEDAFADLVDKINARYIILTYNNMAEKGNDRSNAKLSDEAIMRALKAKGEVKVFHCDHKAFTTGKSERDDNEERIFLCTCNPVSGESGTKAGAYVPSPLNYTGGKFRILDQLLPEFPKDISKCFDLFCGGCNVGINVKAKRTLFTDSCPQLIELFSSMKKLSADEFENSAKQLIARFGLSDTDTNGYEYYGCESSIGLGHFNKDAYARLRDYYTTLPDGSADKSIALYVLIVFGFNNQIRFNAKGAYNLPVGKRDFNSKMKSKLRRFINRLHEGVFEFACSDFRSLDLASVSRDDFVYADPPYLVTTASYNENGGWTENDEKDLLELLDRIHATGCRFALSNVTQSNGKENRLLIDWIDRNRLRYRVIEISRNYSNANYQRKDSGVSREVLVVNY